MIYLEADVIYVSTSTREVHVLYFKNSAICWVSDYSGKHLTKLFTEKLQLSNDDNIAKIQITGNSESHYTLLISKKDRIDSTNSCTKTSQGTAISIKMQSTTRLLLKMVTWNTITKSGFRLAADVSTHSRQG